MSEVGKKVVMVGVQGMRRMNWYEPTKLNGRLPTIFYHTDGYVPTAGPYCLISYRHRSGMFGLERSRIPTDLPVEKVDD